MLQILKALIALLVKRKPESSKSLETSSNEEVITRSNKVAISLDSFFTDLKTGNDRRITHSDEFTKEIEDNAKELLKKVNGFLSELGIISCRVSSGWRPASVNSKIPNAAKKSLHMQGKAIDLVDTTGELDKMILEKEEWLKQHNQPSLLRKYGLWLEHPDATSGWSHLDCSTSRTDRPIRVFRP